MRLITALASTYNLSPFKGVVELSHVADDEVIGAYVVSHQRGTRPYEARVVAVTADSVVIYDLTVDDNAETSQPRCDRIVRRPLPRRAITSVEKTFSYVSPGRQLEPILEDFKANVIFSADSGIDPLELALNEDAYDGDHEDEVDRLRSFVDLLWGTD